MREMRDSGIEWIGEIPSDWKVERLQWHIKEIKEGNNPQQTTSVLSLTNKLGVIPYEEKGAQGNVAKEDCTQYKLAYPNTIVANSMNILIGSVGLCKYFGCVSPVYYVYKPDCGENLYFLNYIFQLHPFQKELRRYAKGIMEIRLRVSSDDILKRLVAFPSPNEQERIVKALDKKCSQVDALIANQEAQIEKLKAYKQSLITEVVTKGLDPTVPMKDSGVDWIGEIPDGWSVLPLKSICEFGKGLPITKADLTPEGIQVVSYGQIHSKQNSGTHLNQSLVRYVSEKYLSSNDTSLGRQGDIFFADTSEDYDGIGNAVLIDTSTETFAGYHTIIARPSTPQNSKFLAYLFLTDMWRSQLRCLASGIKVFSVTQSMLKRVSVIMPEEGAQKLIVEYLDEKCSHIDRLIAIKQSKIEKLNDYKKSLIYEYVTGKKEAI